MEISQHESQEVGVAIIGAGPVGLALGAGLAERGISTEIVERRFEDRDPNASRSFAVHARTLEILEPSGVSDRLMEEGAWRKGIRLYGNVVADFTDLDEYYNTDYNGILVTPQPRVEKALYDRTQELGVPISYDSKLVDLAQDDSGVTYQTKSRDGTVTERRAKYVVACDGARSEVREKHLGLKFEEEPFLNSMILADVEVGQPLPSDYIIASGKPGNFALFTPYKDYTREGDEVPDLYRFIGWTKEEDGKPLDAPVDIDVVRSIVERIYGTDYGIKDNPRWTSRFHAREAIVPQYRGYEPLNRVLLAGDSAHIHSPAGGQGLNLGIGDANNLAWRLYGALYGADEKLLDEYTTERRPVAEGVVSSSHFILRAAIGGTAIQLLRGPVLGGALRFIRPVRHGITGPLSGVGIAYPHGSDEHKLVGQRIPPRELAGGRSRARLQEDAGKFVLFHENGTVMPDIEGWEDRTVTLHHDGPSILVRPDGHGAWVGTSKDAQQFNDSLRSKLRELSGPPREQR